MLAQAGELGLLALPVPAEYDGLSGDMSDMLVVMEEMGRGLMTEPYWATVVASRHYASRAVKPHRHC